MSVSAGSAHTSRPGVRAGRGERSVEQEATLRAVGAWVNQLARTLKTCRLYDANNPTVVRFREDLAQNLARLLAEHGAVQLDFRSDDVLCDGDSLYPARSRDDNLALAFYRDGVNSVTFQPGIDGSEVEAFLDAVLAVTGQENAENDLVTLLWETQLPHLDVDYVPAAGDVGAVAEPGAPEPVAWPGAGAGEPEPEPEPEAAAGAAERSDDWTTGDSTLELEAGFEELESLAPVEVARFLAEFQAEHEVELVTATIAVASAFVHSGSVPEDRTELARFLPRVLRQAVTHGAWAEARETIMLMRECSGGPLALESFTQELFQPISVASVVEKLDQQDPARVAEFVELARLFGDQAVDWLNLALGESQQRQTRRQLAEAVAELCRDNPERLAPYLSDSRWYVVRNIVHILGWIGGDHIVGLLQTALRHPEPRVRQEVVAALGQANPAQARPVLLELLAGADTRIFCSVLHHLSLERDPRTARALVRLLQDPNFEQRPNEERRALYAALGSSGGDEVLPELEQELHRGNWFSRFQEVHRQAVARCIARVGTPLARAVLVRGAASRRTPVRRACEEAMAGLGRD